MYVYKRTQYIHILVWLQVGMHLTREVKERRFLWLTRCMPECVLN